MAPPIIVLPSSVVDPDPNWIRIQQLCGSGFVFRKRTYPVRSGSTQNSKRGKRLDGLTKIAGLIQNFPDVTLLVYGTGIFNKMLFKEYPNGKCTGNIFQKMSNIIYVTVWKGSVSQSLPNNLIKEGAGFRKRGGEVRWAGGGLHPHRRSAEGHHLPPSPRRHQVLTLLVVALSDS